MYIRPARQDTDFGRIADLINATQPHPVSEEMVHEWEKRNPEGQIRQRFVAVIDDQVVGYAISLYHPGFPHKRFSLWVTTDPAYRCQGIGTALYHEAKQHALSHGATHFSGEVRDDSAEGQRFAKKYGFTVRTHLFESTLALKDFDAAPFAGVIEKVEAQGIRLFSLAENDTDEMRRKLHTINEITANQIPNNDSKFPNYEEFCNMISSKWFRAAGQMLAADGDRVIGLSAAGYFEEENYFYNMMTGVHEDYRGRGIALALKLKVIQYAKSYGADYLRTNNDRDNAPMLAINRKLGYQQEPGIYHLIKNEVNL